MNYKLYISKKFNFHLKLWLYNEVSEIHLPTCETSCLLHLLIPVFYYTAN